MKNLCVMAGFGVGMVVGMIVYKHSKDARDMVSTAEKVVKAEMQMVENSAKDGIKEIKKSVKKAVK